MNKLTKVIVAVTLGLMLTFVPIVSVSATNLEGLTPGFWKNHISAWAPTGYATETTLETVFDIPNEYGLDNVKLIEALSFKGGPGEKGAAQILLRAAVAALLNVGDPEIKYYWTEHAVVWNTNNELNSHNRADMLWLAGVWDTYNNMGTID